MFTVPLTRLHAILEECNNQGHTTQLLCGQSALAPGQCSEHYSVAFYDKLSFSFDNRTHTGFTFLSYTVQFRIIS